MSLRGENIKDMSLELSKRTLGDWLEHWAEVTPDKEYIVYSDRNLRFTWGKFNERVDNMAKGLLSIASLRLGSKSSPASG